MSLNPKLMELRPNRSLLNSDFDGYKLSLSEISTITQELKAPVDRLVPDINQYSLLHAKLYALHNHLIGDMGETESVYFIDKELNVQKYWIEPNSNTLLNASLWTLPLQNERTSGDYNISMLFPSDKHAIIADGMGFMYVLDRGSKEKHDQWKVLFSGDVAGPDQKFIVTDAVHKDCKPSELHVLLTSIRQRDGNERHSTILHWITLQEADKWNQVALRELTVDGFVQYAKLERSCQAIYVVSDAGCKFTLDSENEIHKTEAETEPEKRYKWTQGEKDLTLTFAFNEDVCKELIEVSTEVFEIEVKYGNKVLLRGPLHHRIDPDMTCWSLKNNVIEVVLHKELAGVSWTEVVMGDRSGEFQANPEVIGQISERLAPFTSHEEVAPSTGTTFNSQQVEECDFECDKLTIFERLDRDSHSLTHKVNFGSHQVLLNVKCDKDVPSALAVRSDVDACIWQPKMVSDEFCLEHIGTLLAMGYIQASKQQMKFLTCSPDLSYSVICESTKHVFIYCQNKSIAATELRNRVTGQRFTTLAQQQVYSLPSNDGILGIYASNSYLYVLGENCVTCLKL